MLINRFSPTIKTNTEAVKVFCAKSTMIPYSVELVYLPYLMFNYKVVMTMFSGKQRHNEGLFLVDMSTGIPINIKGKLKLKISPEVKNELGKLVSGYPDEVDPKNPLAIEKYEAAGEQVFPVILDNTEAIDKGKRLLLYDMMKLFGAYRYKNFDIVPEKSNTRIIHYPYWLIYHKDNKEGMKFSVLDALNKHRETGQIINAIKKAMVKSWDADFGQVMN